MREIVENGMEVIIKNGGHAIVLDEGSKQHDGDIRTLHQESK